MKANDAQFQERQENSRQLFQTLFSIRTELEKLENEQTIGRKDISSIINAIDQLIEKLISDHEKSFFD